MQLVEPPLPSERMCDIYLWRKCIQWLGACSIVPADHSMFAGNATVETLAYALRDGVLLCRLVARLANDASKEIELVNWRPNDSEFFCIQNIGIFLRICEAHLMVDQTDPLFASSLFNLIDFHKVLQMLAKLSQSPIVRKAFPKLNPFDDLSTGTDGSFYTVKPWPKAQKAPNPAPAFVQSKPQKQSVGQVIKEMLEQERKYVSKLEYIKNCYLTQLGEIIPPDVKEELSVYSELADCHQKLLTDMEEGAIQQSPTQLCHLMLAFRKDCLNMYLRAVRNYISLHKWKSESSDAIEKLHEATLKDGGSMDGWQHIAQIPTRFVSYANIWNGMNQATDVGKPHRKLINQTHNTMLQSNALMDEAMAQYEDQELSTNIEKRIIDMRLPDKNLRLFHYGRLLMQGNVCLLDSDDNEYSCYVFLYQKLLLFTELVGLNMSEYRQRRVIMLHNLEMCDSMMNKLKKASFRLGFKPKNGGTETPFVLIFRKSVDFHRWKIALHTTMNDVNLVKNDYNTHNFELSQFERLSPCGRCGDFVIGFAIAFRCTRCDMVVHKRCIRGSGFCVGDYDMRLLQYNWFAGVISRETAEKQLSSQSVGTYLLRVRPYNNTKFLYSLCVKTPCGIKNVRIQRFKAGEENQPQFGCSSNIKYESIVMLMAHLEMEFYFKKKSALYPVRTPIKQRWAIVLCDYKGNGGNIISLVKDETILIIGKEEEGMGWWRGRNLTNEKPGYFPSAYVRELQENATAAYT